MKIYKTVDEIFNATKEAIEEGLTVDQTHLTAILYTLVDIRDLLLEIKNNTDTI